MIYETRNMGNLKKLAPHTKMAALDWYAAVKKEGIEILVHETIRTLEKQKEYVKTGKSQTLKSYHIVGQALDFVLVNSKGTTLWNDYSSIKGKKVVELAKKYGFTWGGDWKNFKDSPHLQFEFSGYGKDYLPFPGTTHKGDKGHFVKDIQNFLNIKADGIFGADTEKAVKKFQTDHKLVADGIVGIKTYTMMFR